MRVPLCQWVLLAAAAASLGSSREEEFGSSGGAEEEKPSINLPANQPLLFNDLEQYKTQCFETPIHADAAIIEVSVTGLTGNPTVAGDWRPIHPPNDLKNFGGFSLWSKPDFPEDGGPRAQIPVPSGNRAYYTCVTTYSEQGCDFVINVYVDGDNQHPHTVLPLGMPAIWALGNEPRIFRLGSASGKNSALDTHIILTPLEESADMKIIKCDNEEKEVSDEIVPSSKNARSLRRRQLLGLVDLDGDNWVQVDAQEEDICVKVSGKPGSLISLEASQGVRTLAHSIPLSVRVPAAEKCSGPFQVMVNPNTTLTLTASEDLNIFAGWNKAGEDVYDWRGDHGFIDIPRTAFSDLRKTGSIYFRVCTDGEPADEDIFAIVTSSSSSGGVLNLLEGESLHVETEHHDHDATGKWQDFRFYIPSSEKLSTFTLKTTASMPSTKIILVADTVHYTHNPKGYRWQVPVPYTSEATLTFTLDPSLADDRVHAVDCRPPCFVYCTVFSFDRNQGDETTSYDIVLTSEYSMMELKEDEGAEQTLGPAQRQDFHYRFPAMDKSELGPPRALSPVLIGVSCPLGAVKFQVSSTRSFDDDPSKTTKLGKDIVLLDPRLDIMRDAAKDDGLFIRVVNGEEKEASFEITIRMEGEVQELRNGGTPINGAMRANEWNHYIAEISGGIRREDREVHIDLEALAGDPNLYISRTDPFVRAETADFSSENVGNDALELHTNTKDWTDKLYIGVSAAEESAYNLEITWGQASTITLVDGIRSRTDLEQGESQTYSIEGAGDVRVESHTGELQVCPKLPTARDVVTAACKNVTANHVGAFTVPEPMYMDVRAITNATVSIWSSISAPVTLHEGEVLLDALEPSTDRPTRSRVFQVFVLPLVSLIRVTVSPVKFDFNHLTLRARPSGHATWDFKAEKSADDDEHLRLEIDKRHSRMLANRWLEVLVEATDDPVEYSISIDYGQLQLEEQEILTDYPPTPVNSTLYSARLFSLNDAHATFHVKQCLNRVRVMTGPSMANLTNRIGQWDEGMLNEDVIHELTEEDKFALIMAETPRGDIDLDTGSYEVSTLTQLPVRPRLDGLFVHGSVVQFPVPANASQVRAYFVKRDYLGVYHLNSTCGLHAMETMVASRKRARGIRVEEVTFAAGKTAILSPWGENEWAVNVRVGFVNGTEALFAPSANFDIASLVENQIDGAGAADHSESSHRTSAFQIALVFIVAISIYCLVGFLNNVRNNRLSGMNAMPVISQLSARSYEPTLEVPLQRADSPYQPLEESTFYEPPKLLVPMDNTSYVGSSHLGASGSSSRVTHNEWKGF